MDKTGKTGAIPSAAPGQVSDLAPLAVGIREFYRRYVAFHSEHELAQSGCATLFTAHTHV
jgi:hypothetical protein